MDTFDFKYQLREELLQLRPVNKTSESQLAVRCPFCGDSRKSKFSTHFYIKIDLHDDIPILFNCFRCDTSGILTPQIMRSLDIYDLQVNSGLISYNRTATKKMNKSLGIKNNNFDYSVPSPDPNDESNLRKKEYIQNRLGQNDISFEELVQLKTIFKLGQFLKHNEIEKITSKKEKAIALHNNYVGFMTVKNEFINFRQVFPDKIYGRYEKYSIHQNLDNTRKFYTIPTHVDLLKTKNVTINIAEGVFDILGVYYNVKDKETENQIYSAVCGAGYTTVLKYFISMGIIGNVDIHIYSDDDRGPEFYKKMVKELSPWVNGFKLFYNTKKKDFGVPKDDIQIIKKRI